MLLRFLFATVLACSQTNVALSQTAQDLNNQVRVKLVCGPTIEVHQTLSRVAAYQGKGINHIGMETRLYVGEAGNWVITVSAGDEDTCFFMIGGEWDWVDYEMLSDEQ